MKTKGENIHKYLFYEINPVIELIIILQASFHLMIKSSYGMNHQQKTIYATRARPRVNLVVGKNKLCAPNPLAPTALAVAFLCCLKHINKR